MAVEHMMRQVRVREVAYFIFPFNVFDFTCLASFVAMAFNVNLLPHLSPKNSMQGGNGHAATNLRLFVLSMFTSPIQSIMMPFVCLFFLLSSSSSSFSSSSLSTSEVDGNSPKSVRLEARGDALQVSPRRPNI